MKRNVWIVLWACLGCSDEALKVLQSTGPCNADPGSKGEPALPADVFVDGIGVNAFLHYGGTPYDDIAKVTAKMAELGVRRVLVPGNSATVFKRLPAFARDAKIKITLTIDPKFEVQFTRDECPATGRPACRDALAEAIELGPALDSYLITATEPELADPAWAQRTSEKAAALKAALAANPATAHVRLIGPTSDSAVAVGRIAPITPAVDYAAIDWVFNPAPPGELIDRTFATFGNLYGSKPKMVFWIYWRTAMDKSGLSERVQGKYIARALFENFNHRITRTYLHEFLDPSDQWVSGLLRKDFSAKPSFTALSRLIQLLGDTPQPFVPAPLEYKIEGASPLLHHTLLQKQSGAFYLVLWREKVSVDRDDTEAVELVLSTNIASGELFSPLDSDGPVERRSFPSRWRLTVPDHPLVVKLVPVCP